MRLLMIARRGALATGIVNQLPESGLSPHGETYWGNVPFYDSNGRVDLNVVNYLIEHMKECGCQETVFTNSLVGTKTGGRPSLAAVLQ